MSKSARTQQESLEDILSEIWRVQQDVKRGTLRARTDNTTSTPAECRRLDSLARLLTDGNTCAAICYDDVSGKIYTANNDDNIEPAKSYFTCLNEAMRASNSDEREGSINRLILTMVSYDKTIIDIRKKGFGDLLTDVKRKADSGCITISDFDNFVTQSIEIDLVPERDPKRRDAIAIKDDLKRVRTDLYKVLGFLLPELGEEASAGASLRATAVAAGSGEDKIPAGYEDGVFRRKIISAISEGKVYHVTSTGIELPLVGLETETELATAARTAAVGRGAGSGSGRNAEVEALGSSYSAHGRREGAAARRGAAEPILHAEMALISKLVANHEAAVAREREGAAGATESGTGKSRSAAAGEGCERSAILTYIGVSKLCCACCQNIILLSSPRLERDHGLIAGTRGGHAKFYPKWKIPLFLNRSEIESVIKSAQDSLRLLSSPEIRRHYMGKDEATRSPSPPPSHISNFVERVKERSLIGTAVGRAFTATPGAGKSSGHTR